MLSLNCKNVQHVKIYLPCNFEVNPITHFCPLCKLEKRADEIKKKSSPLKLLTQSQPNFDEMILRWSPFKIVSVSAVLYPRWLPLLKIEISSNGQNCSILSQKVPKFELYKHKAKKKYLCLRSPDPPYFSAADPNLFYRQLFDPNFC
jgi:hypothetical protein